MRELLGGVGMAEQKAAMLALMPSTFVGRLEQEKERLEERLASINGVLALLREHPQIGDVLNALHKLGI